MDKSIKKVSESILKNNSTHCKNYDAAISKLTDPNNKFKLVFVCSNKNRIYDITVYQADIDKFKYYSDESITFEARDALFSEDSADRQKLQEING